MSEDILGDRIKTYENAYRIKLPPRIPIIIRLDGIAWHSYTKGLKRPLDENLVECLNETALHLCKKIEGAKVAYLQSDEITILIHNPSFLVNSWFDNNLQKIVSASAAKASAYFTSISHKVFGTTKLAEFDARGFVIPADEVTNAFLFRQQDATRNSIQSLARSLASHKECNNKDSNELQELCWQKGVNWNDLPTSQKRGRCAVKIKYAHTGIDPRTGNTVETLRSKWIIDNNIPIFSKDRNYIDQYLNG